MEHNIIDKIFKEYEPTQNLEEIEWLINKLEKINPTIILEIGVESGGSFKIWEQLLPENGTLIGIDTSNYLTWDILNSKRHIHVIYGDSTKIDTIDKVKEIIGNNKIDFIFIDGNHSYHGVKSDYENYKQFIHNGGIIAFHDIWMHHSSEPIRYDDGYDGAVTRFWKEVDANKEDFQGKTGFNIGIGIIKF